MTMTRRGLLLAVLALAAAPPPADARELKLFTGAKDGTYDRIGRSLAGEARARGVTITPQASPGSVSNLMAVALHQADLALVQYDVLQRVAAQPNGRSLARACRIVMPLYYEEVHLLTRTAAKIRTLADLRGKTIAVGRPSSGAALTALNLLAAAGLKRTDVFFDHAPPAGGLQKLLRGDVEAMLYVGGQPVEMIRAIGPDQGPWVRLFSFDDETLAKLRKANPVLQERVIYKDRYRNLANAKVTRTIAVPCLLVAGADVPAKDVAAICSLVFEQRQALGKAHPKWYEAKRSAARLLISRSGNAHPGAKAYFLGRIPTLGSLRLSSGLPAGTYAKVAAGIRAAAAARKLKIVPQPSQGSDVNTLALLLGQAELGLTQLDSLLFLNLKHPRVARSVRVALPLFPEEVHIVVRQDSKIRTLADLKGKRIHAGPATSGSLSTANFLLVMNHLDPRRDVRLDHSAPSEALQRLLAGELDAMFVTGGRPLALFAALPADAAAKIRLLGLPPASVKRLASEFRSLNSPMPYYGVTIPAKTYPWQPEAVQTIATPALLLARADVDAGKVEALLDAILQTAPTLKHPKWKDVRFAAVRRVARRLPAVLRLHPGTRDLLAGRIRARVQRDYRRLDQALSAYRAANKAFPKRLAELIPDHLKAIPKDPWGRDYRYAAPGRWEAGYEIVCLGADGREGGAGLDQDLATAEGSAWILTNPGEGKPAEAPAGTGGVLEPAESGAPR